MRVTVIGAGQVGLTTALALAYVHREVVIVDNDPAVVASLRERRLVVVHPWATNCAERRSNML